MRRDQASAPSLSPARAGSFTERQLALIQTFADQAVIAIQNGGCSTRQARKRLERQTATAEILKVIASSPADVQPVFQAIVESAARLFATFAATMHNLDGMARCRAQRLHTGFHVDRVKNIPIPRSKSLSVSERILERRIIQIPDITRPECSQMVSPRCGDRGAFAPSLSVPLLREDADRRHLFTPHRSAVVHRQADRAVQTFANQAVIAIGNARLFEEVQARTRDLSEALTYQTGKRQYPEGDRFVADDVGPFSKHRRKRL